MIDMRNPTLRQYEEECARTRARRMAWWRAARFGMFIHWGLYAQLGRNEWAMNLERIPLRDYERLAGSWKPKPRAAREWAALAKAAGMKYMVMTTKHHEGFLLWDSKLSDYNAARRGPGRDLVREYVEAAREQGLKVGFYYSLMDWHHPDGAICATDEAARRRFIEYTHGCVRELMANYGRIDIMWYDVAWPFSNPEGWESLLMNTMVRRLQPHIIINDRSHLREDFGTPEEHVKAAEPGRDWEACMTFNGSWGWQKAPPEDWLSARKVLEMLRTCTAQQGNLLLNVGPLPDGSIPPEAVSRLRAVGQWLGRYGGVVYGRNDPADRLVSALGNWTRRGRKYYFWCTRWPGSELAIGALTGRMAGARLFPGGKKLPFAQVRDRLVVGGLPAACPDKVCGVGVVELNFKTPPRQMFSAGCVMPVVLASDISGKWFSPSVVDWMVSRIVPRRRGVAGAPCAGLRRPLGWQPIRGDDQGFINVHGRFGDADGLAYIARRFRVARAGVWTLHVGHDGGVRVFVDRRPVLAEPVLKNPAVPGRSKAEVALARGVHEIVVALDTAAGRGWGIFFNWGTPPAQRRRIKRPVFPEAC